MCCHLCDSVEHRIYFCSGNQIVRIHPYAWRQRNISHAAAQKVGKHANIESGSHVVR